ncbi:protein-L-isoaspartate O-methyltransferase [Radiomyces spectabilis]|uniref:protein-L-isoaspartate O-methyltransferase n=1 Tax=Radiomyces spectabilis TaxID=64574 RepID=UPI00221EA5C4|nr:protein-L-isoaspartate O-methyltransferase [Radiomyces spectabilis]KAI8391359.1 protein-L-isoaspartate O-methyltransferase [Radiomyces spectabilis]
MKAVDRRDYSRQYPYEDSPQSIGYGATISAPHMHAYALENLQGYLKPGMRALDVGSGSGYLTACMAKMVGKEGRVVGIDHIDGLVEASIRNVSKNDKELLDNGNIKLVVGDGREGYVEDAPYDCIHVGAAAAGRPEKLLSQLKAPGRLFAPVGESQQSIMVYDKKEDGTIAEKKWLSVMYVPLTDPEFQLTRGL